MQADSSRAFVQPSYLCNPACLQLCVPLPLAVQAGRRVRLVLQVYDEMR